jgi:chromosome segregation ATPase
MLCGTYHEAKRNAEKRQLALQKELDKQSARARRSEHCLQAAQSKIQELEKLRMHMETHMNAVEIERDEARVDADHLRRQLRKLRSETKCNQRSIHSALQKLTHSPAVAKRIAAAFHPDKCPKELSGVATELFRWVQSIREQDASVA